MLSAYNLCRRHKFCLKDENSVVHLSEIFNLFSDFSGLKPDTNKREIAGIGPNGSLWYEMNVFIQEIKLSKSLVYTSNRISKK